MPSKTVNRIIYIVIVLIVSTGIFFSYLYVTGSWNFDPATFPAMMEGTADRPYVYRVLMPLISKSMARIIPEWFVGLSQKAPDTLKTMINSLSQGVYIRDAILAVSLMYLSLVGFIFAEGTLLKELEYSDDAQRAIPMLLAILILPLTMYHGYIYDLPQLFLFTLGLIFLLRRQWPLYLPLLILATLNKETSIFLVVIFALYFFRSLDRKTYIILLAAQTIIYLVVHGWFMYLYRNNPGDILVWTLNLHITQYTKYPITFLVTLFFFGGILFMVFKGWRSKPFFLRISFIVFFMMLVLFFVGGREMEFRVFIDILPIFGTLLFPYMRPTRPNPSSIDKPSLQA